MLYKNKCSYLYTNVYLKLKRIHTFRLRFLINDFWNCLCNSSDSGSLLSRCCAIKLVHQFWSGSVLVPKRHFWYWSGSGVMIINTSLYRSGLVSVCIWCNKVLVWFRTMSPFFHFGHPGSINSMQNFITLVLSGVVKKYYGIQLLLSFHHSRLVAEFRDQYYNNSCLVHGSQK